MYPDKSPHEPEEHADTPSSERLHVGNALDDEAPAPRTIGEKTIFIGVRTLLVFFGVTLVSLVFNFVVNDELTVTPSLMIVGPAVGAFAAYREMAKRQRAADSAE